MSKLSNGNPGAMRCIQGLITGSDKDLLLGIDIIAKVEKLDITGTDLYVLWSDISNKDYGLMAHLCKTAPDKLLKEASSKQDYSGRITLREYIASYEA